MPVMSHLQQVPRQVVAPRAVQVTTAEEQSTVQPPVMRSTLNTPVLPLQGHLQVPEVQTIMTPLGLHNQNPDLFGSLHNQIPGPSFQTSPQNLSQTSVASEFKTAAVPAQQPLDLRLRKEPQQQRISQKPSNQPPDVPRPMSVCPSGSHLRERVLAPGSSQLATESIIRQTVPIVQQHTPVQPVQDQTPPSIESDEMEDVENSVPSTPTTSRTSVVTTTGGEITSAKEDNCHSKEAGEQTEDIMNQLLPPEDMDLHITSEKKSLKRVGGATSQKEKASRTNF